MREQRESLVIGDVYRWRCDLATTRINVCLRRSASVRLGSIRHGSHATSDPDRQVAAVRIQCWSTRLRQGISCECILCQKVLEGSCVDVARGTSTFPISTPLFWHILTLLRLQPGSSFVLCDAADTSASIIGYTVATLTPRMKLRPFETLSRSSDSPSRKISTDA